MEKNDAVATAVVPESRLRAFIAKVTKPLRRFTGTPLHEAERIMGASMMHKVRDVSSAFDHPWDFLKQNEHLLKVPYTVSELEWAAQSGVVLSLHSVGVRRLARIMGKMDVSAELLHLCRENDIKSPRHPYWRLVLRPVLRGAEIHTVRNQPEKMRRRQVTAPLGVAASTMCLDFAMHGLLPDGLRLTGTTVPQFGTAEHCILVGNGGHRTSVRPLRVVTGRSDASHYPPMMMWKPHPIHPSTLY